MAKVAGSMPNNYCRACPCAYCDERCDDYLLLLEELLVAENTIDELKQTVDSLQDRLADVCE